MKIRVKIDKYVCERCGHKWISRIKTLPKFCPKCKSNYWNIPKKEKR